MTPNSALKLGFAALSFAFLPAANCDGGAVNVTGDCPAGETCSPLTPTGLVFVAPDIDEGLLDTGYVKQMALGGTQTIQIEEESGTNTVPFTQSFHAAMSGANQRVQSVAGNVVVVRAGQTADAEYLRVTDPATGDLFDRIQITAAAVDHAELAPSAAEAFSQATQGQPELFAPGGGGLVRLVAAGTTNDLLDDSLQLGGTGVTQTQWDHFTVGALAVGTHSVVATTNGHSFTLPFEVAAGPDHLGAGFGTAAGSTLTVGAAATVCSSAYLGTRFIHVPWTFTADNADVSASPFEACAKVTPRAVGPVVVHAHGGALTYDQSFTGARAPGTRAPHVLRGTFGERAANAR